MSTRTQSPSLTTRSIWHKVSVMSTRTQSPSLTTRSIWHKVSVVSETLIDVEITIRSSQRTRHFPKPAYRWHWFCVNLPWHRHPSNMYICRVTTHRSVLYLYTDTGQQFPIYPGFLTKQRYRYITSDHSRTTADIGWFHVSLPHRNIAESKSKTREDTWWKTATIASCIQNQLLNARPHPRRKLIEGEELRL